MAIFFLFTYGAPIILAGVSAVLGVFSALHFLDCTSSAEERTPKAAMLAFGIVVTSILAVLLPQFEELRRVYGGVTEYLWVWILFSFAVGSIFGWGATRSPTSRKKNG